MNLPIEFKEKMQTLLKDDYPLFLAEYERGAWQALRFNTLKKGLCPAQYKKILEELGICEIQPVPWAKNAYYFSDSTHATRDTACNASRQEPENTSCRPGKDPYHEIGLYYIQEPSAMSAAGLLDVHPGERVLDLCAAPGGKSTQLAAALDGQGLLISNEINPSRAKILSQNMERMGITNAIVTSEDSARLAERFGSYFHRVLVDAPCSGEGMFRKNPEAVTEWSPQNVALCAERQAEILDNAAQMLLPGGTLVYSTCTFSPEENEGTIGAFLEKHPEFRIKVEPDNTTHMDFFAPGYPEWGNGSPALQQTHRLWPHKLHGEGHYAAVLIKAGAVPESARSPQLMLSEANYDNPDTICETISSFGHTQDNYILKSPKQKKHGKQNLEYARRNQKTGKQGSNSHNTNKQGASLNMDKTQSSLLHEFLNSTLSEQMMHWIECGNLILFGDQLYRLPEDAPSLDGLRVLRPGLHIGTFRKNRFEPAHALALAIGPEDVRQAVSLSRGEAAARYVRGESLPPSDLSPIMPHDAFGTSPDAASDSQSPCLGIPADTPSLESGLSSLSNGWTLVCLNGYSAGWGKISGGMMKNHYPKGLRKA